MGYQISLDTAWRRNRGRLDTASGHSRASVNVRGCFTGSDVVGGHGEKIGGEQAVCSPPPRAPGRDGELQSPLKRVSEGERIFGVELVHTGGKEAAWGLEGMSEDTELVPQGSGPRLSRESEIPGTFLERFLGLNSDLASQSLWKWSPAGCIFLKLGPDRISRPL